MLKASKSKSVLSWIVHLKIPFPVLVIKSWSFSKIRESLALKSFASTFLIFVSLLLQNISTYPFSSYVSESALQILSTSWFSQLTEPSRDFLQLNLYGWPCNVFFFALPNVKLLLGGVLTSVNRLNIAPTILDVAALKVGLSPSKKIFFYFSNSPSKMMKNDFYFILKALFVLKIFKFLS